MPGISAKWIRSCRTQGPGLGVFGRGASFFFLFWASGFFQRFSASGWSKHALPQILPTLLHYLQRSFGNDGSTCSSCSRSWWRCSRKPRNKRQPTRPRGLRGLLLQRKGFSRDTSRSRWRAATLRHPKTLGEGPCKRSSSRAPCRRLHFSSQALRTCPRRKCMHSLSSQAI